MHQTFFMPSSSSPSFPLQAAILREFQVPAPGVEGVQVFSKHTKKEVSFKISVSFAAPEWFASEPSR
jgi:hypothetical protein